MKKSRQFSELSEEEQLFAMSKRTGYSVEKIREIRERMKADIDHIKTLPMATQEQTENLYRKCRWWWSFE